MLIAYDNVFQLDGSSGVFKGPYISVSNHGTNFMLSMQAESFKVEHEQGKTSVSLFRNLSVGEARELAHSLLERADEMEEQQKQWQTVTMTSMVK